MWNGGGGRGLVISADAPLGAYLAARDGTLLNFERDNTLVRRADPNKPLYKPEFWEKVQKLDQNGNTQDPSYGCMLAGVPRMGPPVKIVQTGQFMFARVGGDYKIAGYDLHLTEETTTTGAASRPLGHSETSARWGLAGGHPLDVGRGLAWPGGGPA